MLPQLIVPIREALNTRDPVVVKRTLRVIQVRASGAWRGAHYVGRIPRGPLQA